jgi:hypothetical protein
MDLPISPMRPYKDIQRVTDAHITPVMPCPSPSGIKSDPNSWYFRQGKARTFTTMANKPGAKLNHG